MMAMKAAMMKAMALKALALLVGKALIVSKIALLLAIIIGLKKLLHQEKHVTYEVSALNAPNLPMLLSLLKSDDYHPFRF